MNFSFFEKENLPRDFLMISCSLIIPWVIYGDKQETLDLFSGPKSKFLSFEYSARLFSTKLSNRSKALALEGSKFI